VINTTNIELNSAGRKSITTTCFGPQLAIVRLYTLKRILNTVPENCEFPLDVHFRVEKSYDGTHLAFGGTLDRRCHFKHVSLKKQSRFYYCETSTAHR